MNEAGWIGVASLFVAGLFGWLNKRDSLRHDADVAALKNQNSTQATQIATLAAKGEKCEAEHAVKDAKIKACEELHESMELRVGKLEKAIGQK